MKKLIFAALFFSSAVFAEQVIVRKTDCSVLGNFKVKVSGLDHGRMGRKYLKADLPYFEDCDKTEMFFLWILKFHENKPNFQSKQDLCVQTMGQLSKLVLRYHNKA